MLAAGNLPAVTENPLAGQLLQIFIGRQILTKRYGRCTVNHRRGQTDNAPDPARQDHVINGLHGQLVAAHQRFSKVPNKICRNCRVLHNPAAAERITDNFLKAVNANFKNSRIF